MNSVIRWLRGEPVALIAGALTAGMDVAVSFGLHLSDGQRSAVLGVGSALLALIARSTVTPVASSLPAMVQDEAPVPVVQS